MKPTKYVLHHYPATRSVRVRWALHETVGDDFEIRRVELYEGAQYERDYLAVNPNHNVPMLEIHWEDGSVQHMLESVAMVEWLADRHPDKALCPSPTSGRDRADYLQLMHFGGTWLDMMLWQIRIHTHILGEQDADSKTLKRYREKFTTDGEPQLLSRLEKHEYILGDRLSAADFVIGHIVFWAKGYQLCENERFSGYIAKLMTHAGLNKSLDDLSTFQVAPNEGQELASRFNG
ncbi:MAG: glutathione S-transferase family protein [Halioglobus sp.]